MQTQALDRNCNSTSLVISLLDRLLRSLVLDLRLIFQMWLWQKLRWAGMELEFFHIYKMFIDSLCVRSLKIRILNKKVTIPNMPIPIWSHSKHLSALTLNLYRDKMFTTVHTRLPKKFLWARETQDGKTLFMWTYFSQLTSLHLLLGNTVFHN